MTLPPDERAISLALLRGFIRNAPASDPNLAPAMRAYGRLSGGDRMTPDEAVAAFGDTWSVSTGRYTGPADHRRVTPAEYERATAVALVARAKHIRGDNT